MSEIGLSDLFEQHKMSEDQALSRTGYTKAQLKRARGSVVRDGEISQEQAEKLFREYAQKTGNTSEDDRRDLRLDLAIALCYGTSAETNLSDRFLDADDPDSCLSYFADILTAEGSPLAGKNNFLRIFARSLAGFADLTVEAIKNNDWLAQNRAMVYEVDIQYAHVCFDYADRITGHLTPSERRMVVRGLRKKAGEGRSSEYAPEGSGVPGSDPVSRGVGSGIVPDPSRVGVSRGGVGPYS